MDLTEVTSFLGVTAKQTLALLIVGILLWVFIRQTFLKDFGKDVKEIKGGIKSINDELGMVKDEVTDLHNAAKEIQMHLQTQSSNKFSPQHSLAQKPLFSAYGKPGSPMEPSEEGKKLLEDSHFYDMYSQLKDEIFRQMDSMNLRTLYDYESGASKALFLLSDNPAMDVVKDYAVNNSDKPLELIFGVGSWIIRDDYKKHKEDN